MAEHLALLHTAPGLVNVFDRLFQELAPEIPRSHAVDGSLLGEARENDGITPRLNRRVATALFNAADGGARVVMCTCSSIGPCVDVARPLLDCPVLRVDRPMAEAAVSRANTVAVAATLTSTLNPTRSIILDAAREAGRTVDVKDVLCASAWAAYERGDRAGYVNEIEADLRRAASEADVIVLAQASMAEAAERLSDLATPILTSPRTGTEAAVAAWRAAG